MHILAETHLPPLFMVLFKNCFHGANCLKSLEFTTVSFFLPKCCWQCCLKNSGAFGVSGKVQFVAFFKLFIKSPGTVFISHSCTEQKNLGFVLRKDLTSLQGLHYSQLNKPFLTICNIPYCCMSPSFYLTLHRVDLRCDRFYQVYLKNY